MKDRAIFFVMSLSAILAGCVVNVTEQDTQRGASASSQGVTNVYLDASIYRDALNVQASPIESLVATGIFSLWSSGSSTASSLAQEVNMYWTIDTVHKAQLYAEATGPRKELLSINKIDATIPARIALQVYTTSANVSVQGMIGNTIVAGSSSDITFNTPGRVNLQTVSGKISGSTDLGGSLQSGSGDITVTLSSRNFETIYARDTTGNVLIYLPPGAGATFFLAVNGGQIDVNYDGVNQASSSAIQNVNVNGGGKVINVATGKGNITIRDIK